MADINLRSIASGFTVQGVGFLSNIITVIVLTKHLSVSAFGIFSLWVSVITVLTVFSSSGFTDFAVREISEALSNRNNKKVKEVLFYCFCGSVSLLLLISSSLIGYFSFFDPSMVDIVPLFIMTIICMVAISVIGSMVRGFGFPILGQCISVLLFPLVFLIGVLIAYMPSLALDFYSEKGAFLLRVTSSALTFIVVLGIFLGRFGTETKSFYKVKFHSPWIMSSLSFMAIGFLGVMTRQIGIFLLAWYLAPDAVAEYRLVLLGLSVFEQIAMVGLVLLQADFAKINLKHRFSEIQSQIFKIYGAIFAAGVTAFLILFFWGDILIRLFFGSSYEAILTPLLFGIVGYCINLGFGPVGILLTMQGNTSLVVHHLTIALTLNVLVSTILVPWLGVLAVVLGFFVGSLAFNALSWRACNNVVGLDPSLFQVVRHRASGFCFFN